MGLVKASIASSSLSAEEKARLTGSIDTNIGWLNKADGEVQAAGDMASLEGAISRVEWQMATIRSELRANAGLLACEDMDAKVDNAINASIMVNDKIDRLSITASDKAWYDSELVIYNGHVYNASIYSLKARESFREVSGAAGGDACYSDGLAQIALAQDEMARAYLSLDKIFHSMDQ